VPSDEIVMLTVEEEGEVELSEAALSMGCLMGSTGTESAIESMAEAVWSWALL